ncbi:Uncharacterized response regulatory protein SA0215 [uncultured Ruminococcus sp.]|nr:Uncharacterized response regulatory protein SA0215 [uncultured Ruminococcus sp.]SCI19568.1 Uncharacterized response regulatory protein SA0215 [uncultured Clostridium sp.]
MNEQIKVLIVDDEKLFRDHLRTILCRHQEDFFVCGEAKNGQEALSVMASEYPNIVLADINMPHMDGVEFTKHLKEMSPMTEVVLITGFSEFEYARQAVQLGVLEYILKPFTEEELIECLHKSKQKILERREQEKRFEQNYLFASSRFLLELVDGECAHPEEAEKMLKEYKFSFSIRENSVAVLIRIEDYLKYWMGFQDKYAVKYAVCNILDERIGANWNYASFNAGGYQVGMLINVSEKERYSLQSELTEINHLCQKHLRCRIEVFVSGVDAGLDAIHRNWVNVQNQMNEFRREMIIPDLLFGNGSTLYKQFVQADEGKATKSRMLLIDALEFMMENFADPELGIDLIASKMYVSSSYLRKVFQSGIGRTVMGVLLDIRMDQASQQIMRGNTRISDIAQAVGYRDPAYFSRAFKKKFGMTPSEYELYCQK